MEVFMLARFDSLLTLLRLQWRPGRARRGQLAASGRPGLLERGHAHAVPSLRCRLAAGRMQEPTCLSVCTGIGDWCILRVLKRVCVGNVLCHSNSSQMPLMAS